MLDSSEVAQVSGNVRRPHEVGRTAVQIHSDHFAYRVLDASHVLGGLLFVYLMPWQVQSGDVVQALDGIVNLEGAAAIAPFAESPPVAPDR